MRRAATALAIACLAAACASASAPPSPVALRVVMADDWASAPRVGEAIEAFEDEHEHVSVQVQGSPFSQIPDVVEGAIELGQPPDLAHWHAFAAASAGLAEPLGDLWEQHGLREEAYLPGAVEDVTWLGEPYGVPLDVNALVLMANEDHLVAAGIEPRDLARPDGFRTAASTLVDRDVADHALAVSASSWTAYGWIVSNGGEVVHVDEDGRPTFTFDDPATVEALDRLAALVERGDAPAPFAPDLSLDAVAAFATGNISMHVSGSWDLPTTRRAHQADQVVDDVRILPLPQRDPAHPRTVLGGSSMFVPVGAEHPELAFELMLALTEDDVAVDLAVEEGRLPARREAYEDPVFSSTPDLAAFVDELETAEVMPLIAYPDVAAAFSDALQAILSLRTDADEAMADMQSFAERRYGEG